MEREAPEGEDGGASDGLQAFCECVYAGSVSGGSDGSTAGVSVVDMESMADCAPSRRGCHTQPANVAIPVAVLTPLFWRRDRDVPVNADIELKGWHRAEEK